jgi:DNA-binding transcriptional regulator LsrR (DeoR family)
LTQSHIADALSLNPAHVCRQLKQLKNDGVLEYRHRRLRIFDHHALTRLVARRDGLFLTCGPGAIAVCSAKDLPPTMD